jgi:hypothetical protein
MLNNAIGMMIDCKVVLSDFAIELLPDRVRPEVYRLRTQALECMQDKLSSCKDKKSQKGKSSELRKIALD